VSTESDTGRVVVMPAAEHRCAPGWRSKVASDGKRYSIPPSSFDCPKGTVWECGCGRAWVSRGAISPHSPGFTYWRREGRWSRWRRTSRPDRPT
jgi:hypothetical protein